jgi:DNA-binding HxlR family transcriptional regulator
MARSYGIEDCPVARTLDLIGERWTVLLLRDLLLHGPRRFQDFQTSLPGVAPNILSARLKAMEDDGLLQRVPYSERPLRVEYILTDKGKSLGPVVRAMREWGLKHSGQPS